MPPPPTGATVPPPPPRKSSTDNPIAIAALAVSILGVLLAIFVVGFFFGLVGFVLGIVAVRRARSGRGSRGMAISGLWLGVLAMVLSIAALVVFVSVLRSGEDTIRDGIATTSQNTEHPPQDDLETVVCASSNTGALATATVRIVNRSEGASIYRVVVEWDTEDGGTVSDEVTTEYLGVDEGLNLDFIELGGRALADSCRVVRIERSAWPFF